MANSSREGVFQRGSRFLREVWVELKKTSWPTYDDIKKSTAVVLAAVAIVTLWIGGLDYFFGKIRGLFGW